MDWQQKMAALKALDDGVSLKMAAPGQWYVDTAIVRKRGILLESVGGHRVDPEAAVNWCWLFLNDPIGDCLVIATNRGADRLAVRWNGFMWLAVKEAVHVER